MSEEDIKAEQKAEADRQHAAAKRTLASLTEQERRDQDSHVNSMLTTDAHVGKTGTGEPHKEQEMEDRKVDKKSVTGGDTEDTSRVQTVDLETPGKGVTDQVTTEPKYARPAGGAPHPPNIVQRAAAAVKEAVGEEEEAGPEVGAEPGSEAEAEEEPAHKTGNKKRKR